MPSDMLQVDRLDRDQLALRLIARRIAVFRSAVTGAAERARALLSAGGGTGRAGVELGLFAAGRIDAARFAALNTGGPVLDATSRERVECAAAVLANILVAGDESFVIDVPSGTSVRLAVASALARLGRAFGAATVIELVRAGRFAPSEHDRLLDWYGFDEWSRAERMAAPPLVVRLDGADLRGASFANFMDGAAHVVVVPSDAATPAPLACLVTPAVLVAQTADHTGLDTFADFDGPAIAALMASDAACFVHDPAAGKSPWQRIRIWNRPATSPRRTIGGISPRQQLDALAHLEALAQRPALSNTPVDALAPGAGDPADRLANWLLHESGVA